MSHEGRYRFGKAHRLRRRREFLVVQRQGERRRGKYMTVIARTRADASEEGPRLGITASRRVGNSVQRNRIKRLIREAFRTARHRFPQGVDFVVVAARRARGASFEGIRGELITSARALGKRVGA